MWCLIATCQETYAPLPDQTAQQNGAGNVFRRRPIGLIGLIYIIIGLVVAWNRGYITVDLLKRVLSAILAVLLWWLVLLGVSLHIH
jgi:hypothetical protein